MVAEGRLCLAHERRKAEREGEAQIGVRLWGTRFQVKQQETRGAAEACSNQDMVWTKNDIDQLEGNKIFSVSRHIVNGAPCEFWVIKKKMRSIETSCF